MTTEMKSSRLDSAEGIFPQLVDMIYKDVIGRGNLRTVYRGKIKENHVAKTVAIADYYKPEDEKSSREWEEESETWSKKDHPNVMRMLAYFCGKDERFRILEFGEPTLKQWMDKDKKSSWSVQLGMLTQIAKGLHYLESKDEAKSSPWFSTSNIFFRSDSILFVEYGSSTYKKIGGVRWYVPERFSETNTSYRKGYSYCMYLFLYCFLTKQVPYKGIPCVDIGKKVASGVQPTIPDRCREDKEIPAGYLALMSECGKFNPEERPSMEDIVAKLETMNIVVDVHFV